MTLTIFIVLTLIAEYFVLRNITPFLILRNKAINVRTVNEKDNNRYGSVYRENNQLIICFYWSKKINLITDINIIKAYTTVDFGLENDYYNLEIEFPNGDKLIFNPYSPSHRDFVSDIIYEITQKNIDLNVFSSWNTIQKMNLEILYEDNHLIAINKPAGVLSQGDKTGDKVLADYVKEYIVKKYNKPGEAFLGVIHRIDRPVSGIVLLAKTSKALSRMNEQFKTREVQKTYWAIVEQKPAEPQATLVHWLKKNEEKNKSQAFSKEVKGALRCELEYEYKMNSERYHLLEVKPHTGRHHQIRVQLSTIGCIIKGDLKYGAKRSNSDGSISLHARQLKFIHPVKKEEIVITAPVPKDAIWQFFEGQLAE